MPKMLIEVNANIRKNCCDRSFVVPFRGGFTKVHFEKDWLDFGGATYFEK